MWIYIRSWDKTKWHMLKQYFLYGNAKSKTFHNYTVNVIRLFVLEIYFTCKTWFNNNIKNRWNLNDLYITQIIPILTHKVWINLIYNKLNIFLRERRIVKIIIRQKAMNSAISSKLEELLEIKKIQFLAPWAYV